MVCSWHIAGYGDVRRATQPPHAHRKVLHAKDAHTKARVMAWHARQPGRGGTTYRSPKIMRYIAFYRPNYVKKLKVQLQGPRARQT